MSAHPADILDCIGHTTLLPLRHVAPANGARILLKLESENPTGSMKDRMALAMIEAAESDGRLERGGSVVEYTGAGRACRSRSSARSRAIRSASSPRMRSPKRSSSTCGAGGRG